MARSTKKKATDDTPEPAVTRGEVTKDNPSGITAVSEEHAHRIGQFRGFGGPGAAGATVAGPEAHVATEGGTKPLPDRTRPEGVTTSGGAVPNDEDQPTSQAAALRSGIEDNGDNTHEADVEGSPATQNKEGEENAGGEE